MFKDQYFAVFYYISVNPQSRTSRLWDDCISTLKTQLLGTGSKRNSEVLDDDDKGYAGKRRKSQEGDSLTDALYNAGLDLDDEVNDDAKKSDEDSKDASADDAEIKAFQEACEADAKVAKGKPKAKRGGAKSGRGGKKK